jgi:gas vesicle protein
MERDSIGAFGIGLVAGTLIGLAIGTLYAPHKGSVTRELIKERAEEVKGKAEDLVEKAKEKVGELRRREA